MTATANTETVTVTDASGKKLTVDLDQTTDLITKLLAARKAGYDARRKARAAAQDASKAEREAKKAARTADAIAKKAAKVAALEAKLAELKAPKKAA